MSAGRHIGLLSILAALLCTQLVAQQSSSSQAALRPLLPLDVLRLDDIGQVTLSPDGLLLAYVVRKSPASVIENSSRNADYSATEEIWIASPRGGQPQKITNQLDSGTIFTQVIFSPDSRKLAFVALKNWDGSLWVCDLMSKQLKLLVAGRVNFGSTFERTLAWVSNQDLMYSQVTGPKSLFLSIHESTKAAAHTWAEARKGRSPTKSALDSGLKETYENQTKGTLGVINVLTGAQRVISSGDFNDMQVSPDDRYVAVLKQIGFHRPKANETLKHPSAQKYGFTVVTTSGKVLEETMKVEDVIPRSFSWSPDSSHLALAAWSDTSEHRRLQLFIYKPAEGALIPIGGDNFFPLAGGFQSPPELAWTSKNELVVLGRQNSSNPAQLGNGASERTRPDWWIVNASGPERNLTEKMKFAPSRLLAEPNGESFLGVADGELWKISSRLTAPDNLTRDFTPKVSSITWPRQASSLTRNLTKVVLSVNSGNEVELYTFELNPGGFKPLTVSLSSPTLRDYSAAAGVAVFTTNDRTGTYLSISEGFTKTREIVAANTFLRDVAEGSVKKIQYRGLDGQDLVGWLILPINYVEGSRYPLVVRVYGGTVYGDSPPDIARINESHPLNLQLLASHGYAVMLPSMPLKAGPDSSDPFMELTKGVLPAVDKVIEMNIADPQRVGLIGQSFGGYSTYGLITQTNRFKAAVAMAGLSNLISLYGQFNATDRYSNTSHDNSFHLSWSESGQGRLGNPPWKDVGRYIRNSPLFYVERVQTPLLIIHGDMDYVAMQQGEEFFTALYRQNKRARFVRYWGEGHVISNNPANVTDMWEQIFDWFDTYLGGSKNRSQQP